DTLIAAGHWHQGDPEIWIIADSGYDGPRLAFLLADLPAQILVRLRSDRVLAFPPAPQPPEARGRRARHGARFAFTDPASWPAPAHATTTDTTRYGQAHARAWERLHPRLTRTGAAHPPLRLARRLAEDVRRPWERPPPPPARLSPARVRRGFRRIRHAAALPANPPKFTRPGPGRPTASPDSRRAPLHNPGKTRKPDIKR